MAFGPIPEHNLIHRHENWHVISRDLPYSNKGDIAHQNQVRRAAPKSFSWTILAVTI
jgi:hypothetical protein